MTFKLHFWVNRGLVLYLGILVRVINVTHDNTQTLDHSLSNHVSLILSKHLLQHRQHQRATDLLLQRQKTQFLFIKLQLCI